MLFYRAIDAAGRLQLTATQADAKKINKEFDTIEVPTDKAGLRDILQDLIDRAQDTQPVAADSSDAPPAARPQPASDDVEHSERCPKCHVFLTRTEVGAKMIAAGQDMSSLQTWIEYVPSWAVDGIAQAIHQRRKSDAEASEQLAEVPEEPSDEASAS